MLTEKRFNALYKYFSLILHDVTQHISISRVQKQFGENSTLILTRTAWKREIFRSTTAIQRGRELHLTEDLQAEGNNAL
jgi:hypothetical protein